MAKCQRCGFDLRSGIAEWFANLGRLGVLCQIDVVLRTWISIAILGTKRERGILALVGVRLCDDRNLYGKRRLALEHAIVVGRLVYDRAAHLCCSDGIYVWVSIRQAWG